MNYNICPECKTPNEPEYQYCKNCGAPVQRHGGAGPDFAQSGAQNSQNYNQGACNQAPPPPAGPYSYAPRGDIRIDGIPENHVAAYVGKNSFKIINCFIKLQSTGSKVAWCWPPFIWGFFLGPIGVMIWFLYRKMYKNACIAGAIDIALSAVSAILASVWGIGESVYEEFQNIMDNALATNTFNYSGFLDFATSRRTVVSLSFSSIVRLIGIAVAILAGIFGMYLYKKHVVESIRKFQPLSNEPGYLTYGLASVGGTSAGAAILGVLAVSVASGVISNMIQLAVNLIRS